MEAGGALSGIGVNSSFAQPFLGRAFAAEFSQTARWSLSPPALKTQEESFQQDCRHLAGDAGAGCGKKNVLQPLFYPAWDILPNEAKLPHFVPDVISERLETLSRPDGMAAREATLSSDVCQRPGTGGGHQCYEPLLQRTFSAGEMARRTKSLEPG